MSKQLEFTFTTGPHTGKTYTFRGDLVKIGSANDNDLVIPDKYIGKLHAIVHVEKQGITLQNKSVVGATFVNSEKIDKCLLNDGDLIAFGGGMTMRFNCSESTETFQAPFRTPSASSFRLQVDAGPLKWSQYDFSKELVKVGSRRGCDLLLAGQGVENEHFQIVAEGNDFVLYNEAEAGTKVNGKGVERKALQDGDRIEFGQSMAVIFNEMVTDVRLAKPRAKGNDGPLKRMRRKVGFFENPVVVGGIIAYVSLLVIVVVVLLTADLSSEDDIPFGGGFGYDSMARGVYITKSIGQEHFEHVVKIRGQVANEEGLPYQIVSGSTLLYDSAAGPGDSKSPWPKDPPYKPTIISDAAESTKDLDLGRQNYMNRNIAPEALYMSILHFRKALAYCPKAEATKMAAIQEELYKSEKELALIFEGEWRKARFKMNAGDHQGAREIYQFLRSLLPNQNNPGNVYARNAQIRVSSAIE